MFFHCSFINSPTGTLEKVENFCSVVAGIEPVFVSHSDNPEDPISGSVPLSKGVSHCNSLGMMEPGGRKIHSTTLQGNPVSLKEIARKRQREESQTQLLPWLSQLYIFRHSYTLVIIKYTLIYTIP